MSLFELRRVVTRLSATLSLLLVGACASAAPPAAPLSPEVVEIWSEGTMPGRPPSATPERENRVERGYRQVTLLENVTYPTMTVVRPPPNIANGSAMIVLPGGGFNSLAWDLEGLEIANFLAERGVTAFVLKYRVREPTPEQFAEFYREPTGARLMVVLADNVSEATSDALQAVRLVRANASRYGVSSNRIGMIGFSAGAITTMRVLHEANDAARPNIAASIYGFDPDEGAPLATPPLLIAHSRDDPLIPAASAEALGERWRAAGGSAEVHIYETGSHGFGLGHPGTESEAFASQFEAWLRAQSFIPARHSSARP